MLKLEELRNDAIVRGVIPNLAVTVISINAIGDLYHVMSDISQVFEVV